MPGIRAALRAKLRPYLRTATVALAAAPLIATASPASAEIFTDHAEPRPQLTAKKKEAKRQPHTDRARRVLSIASQQAGDPYRYGAAGPNAFDCSGLVYYSAHRAGYRAVPRTSSAQSGFMRHISRNAMRPGDFVFFTGSGGVYHVGIFVGRPGGRVTILHAPYSGTRVRREAVWTNSWFAGTLRGK